MPMVPMPGGGDDADSSGGFSIHSLSRMAKIEKASRVVVAAAIISNQMATLEELTRAWNQGLKFVLKVDISLMFTIRFIFQKHHSIFLRSSNFH